MDELKFPIYGSPGEFKIFTLEKETGDYLEDFKTIGFIHKTNFFSPYFYVNDGVPSVELLTFSNREGESVVCLWDHNEELFSFYCNTHEYRMKCVSELIFIARQIVAIEKDLKRLVEEDN